MLAGEEVPEHHDARRGHLRQDVPALAQGRGAAPHDELVEAQADEREHHEDGELAPPGEVVPVREDEAHRGEVVEDRRGAEGDARGDDGVDAEGLGEEDHDPEVDARGDDADDAELEELRGELLDATHARPLVQFDVHDVARAPLGLEVGLAHVLAGHAERGDDEAAHQPDGDHDAAPAGDGVARGAAHDRVDEHDEGDDEGDEAHDGHRVHGLDREGRDPLGGERDHLGERVLGLARHALLAAVVDLVGPEAEGGDDAAQEEVGLAVLREGLEGASAHEAEVRAVVDELGPQLVHKAVVGLRGVALEAGVRVAVVADAVDHLGAGRPLVHHPLDHVHVVLEVGVDRDGDVAAAGEGIHKPRVEGALVPLVVRELDPGEDAVGRVEGLDDAPRGVLRAVVHEDYAALGRDLALAHQVADGVREDLAREGEDLLLVVAGDDDTEQRRAVAPRRRDDVEVSVAQGVSPNNLCILMVLSISQYTIGLIDLHV